MKTSTKNVIYAGIFSLITAGIGIVAGSKGTVTYYQQKINNSVSSQTDITINNDDTWSDTIGKLMEEYTTTKNTVISLTAENVSLKTDNEKLLAERESLQAANLELQKKIDNQKNAKSISAANQTAYEGNDEYQDFMTLCKPYQRHRFDIKDSLSINGKQYSGFSMYDIYSDSYAYFNLEGKYTKLSFDMGVTDNSDPNTIGKLIITLDGNVLTTCEANGNELLKHFEVELNNANQLKLEFTNTSTVYGLVNLKVK